MSEQKNRMPEGWSVKPLAWEHGHARTAFGSAYAIHHRADGMWEAVGCGSFVTPTPMPDVLSAVAAAQADYERRILSALVAPPSSPSLAGLQAEVERLREALQAAKRRFIQIENIIARNLGRQSEKIEDARSIATAGWLAIGTTLAKQEAHNAE